MLFVLHYTVLDQATALNRFTQWQPPVEFKGHWAAVDGKTGFALIEATPAQVIEATAAFQDVIDFSAHAVMAVDEALPVFLKSAAWAAEVDSR